MCKHNNGWEKMNDGRLKCDLCGMVFSQEIAMKLTPLGRFLNG